MRIPLSDEWDEYADPADEEILAVDEYIRRQDYPDIARHTTRFVQPKADLDDDSWRRMTAERAATLHRQSGA